MKKLCACVALALCVLLTAALLAGCEKSPNPSQNDKTEQYDDTQIENRLEKSGRYTVNGQELDYVFRVPQLKADTEAAKAINERIEKRFGNSADLALALVEKGEDCEILHVDWRSYWTDSLLCLVLEMGPTRMPDEYAVYRYDFASGKEVAAMELPALKGVSRQKLEQIVQKTVLREYDAMPIGEHFTEEFLNTYYRELLPLRYDTFSHAKDGMDNIFQTGDELQMVGRMFTPAGSGSFSHTFTLQMQDQAVKKTAAYDYFEAELKDNQVTLTMSKTGDSADFVEQACHGAPGQHLKFNEPYPVAGTFSDYIDLFFGNIGPTYAPYMFLLTADHRLEMVDLSKGIYYGYFVAMPIPGLTDIQTVEEKTVDNGQSGNTLVHAVDSSGNRYDLATWQFAAMSAYPGLMTDDCLWESDNILHKTDGGGSYESRELLKFWRDGSFSVESRLPDVGISTTMSGNFSLAGMTEEGMIFRFDLRSEDMKQAYIGTMAVRVQPGANGLLSMEAKILSGTELFDMPNQFVSLKRVENQ